MENKTVRYGDAGPWTEMLQLALRRRGLYPSRPDGIFGPLTLAALRRFQSGAGLADDGVCGPLTWRALEPWLFGYEVYTVMPGDTFYRIALRYGVNLSLLIGANPGVDPFNLPAGRRMIVPMRFDVVPSDVSFTSALLYYCIRGLAARYPFLRVGSVGKSVMGQDIPTVVIGGGQTQVFYNASHHANEWITTAVLMRFLEEYARAVLTGGNIRGENAAALIGDVALHLIPMVNPDGVDLVTGALDSGYFFDGAAAIASDYPGIPFPDGWKANVVGIDTNLQYPAGWEEARRIKTAQGFVSPAPRDFTGEAALEAPESRAVYDYTIKNDFALTVSLHTQGEVIYWRYLDYDVPGAYEIAGAFSAVSGYAVENVPYASGFAGYKDWFIYRYRRPGFTIELGQGESPLPLSAFPEIYSDALGILAAGMTLARDLR